MNDLEQPLTHISRSRQYSTLSMLLTIGLNDYLGLQWTTRDASNDLERPWVTCRLQLCVSCRAALLSRTKCVSTTSTTTRSLTLKSARAASWPTRSTTSSTSSDSKTLSLSPSLSLLHTHTHLYRHTRVHSLSLFAAPVFRPCDLLLVCSLQILLLTYLLTVRNTNLLHKFVTQRH